MDASPRSFRLPFWVPRSASGKQKTQELSLPASAGTSACAGEIYSPASYPLAIKPLCHWTAERRARVSRCQRFGSLPLVDHAEAVALGIGQDDEVRVRRSLVPRHLGGAQTDEPPDLGGLILGVKVEVNSRRDLNVRGTTVEVEVRSHAVARAQHLGAVV